MNLSELIEKAMTAKNAEELLKMAKAENIELSAEGEVTVLKLECKSCNYKFSQKISL